MRDYSFVPVAETEVDITPGWLTTALRGTGLVVDVDTVVAQRVGAGQTGAAHRLSISYRHAPDNAPTSLIAKLANGDAAARQRVAPGYCKEVGFYTELVSTLDVRTPRCRYGARNDDGTSFTLLLDDLAPATPGIQAAGCSIAQATASVRNLAGLHAPRWNDPTLFDYHFLEPTDEAAAAFLGEIMVNATQEFVARYADSLGPEDVRTLRESATATTKWLLTRPEPFAVIHGDYRLDNLMFPPAGDGVFAVDWQTVTVGPPARDLAYFLGTSLTAEDRRVAEAQLIAAYHQDLVARGVKAYSLEACYEDYRLGQLQGPLITVLGCIYATAGRNAQADEMFLAMASRSCAAIRDLGSVDAVIGKPAEIFK